MRRKLLTHKRLLIGVFLALCLAILIPASTLAGVAPAEQGKAAAKSFNAILTPTSMDATVIGLNWPKRDTADTNVWPIMDMIGGNPTLTGWLINGRSIYGTASGDVSGGFTFTYGGIVDPLQSGSIEGIVVIQTAQGFLYVTALGGCKTKIIDLYPTIPPLPMTLSADFSGLYAMEAGTGIYGKVKGTGRFSPDRGKPLILHLAPDQHVISIEGSIKMCGTYSY